MEKLKDLGGVPTSDIQTSFRIQLLWLADNTYSTRERGLWDLLINVVTASHTSESTKYKFDARMVDVELKMKKILLLKIPVSETAWEETEWTFHVDTHP